MKTYSYFSRTDGTFMGQWNMMEPKDFDGAWYGDPEADIIKPDGTVFRQRFDASPDWHRVEGAFSGHYVCGEGEQPRLSDAYYRTKHIAERRNAYFNAGISTDDLIVALWEKTFEGGTAADEIQAKRIEIKERFPKK